MIKEGIILKAEILSEYIYILKLIWLLTKNNLLSNQMKEGSTKEQLIDELKEAVKKTTLSELLSDTGHYELAESIFFIIEQRVNECSKL
ncbi:hypothetical protein GUP84_004131 [Salmonella enterica]|uniref:hypothetical protein n=1 Tax=Salmonella enterica TaxID=28901 RepID=UPI000D5798D7|nr:hypothetical protein [Salmonella enterica]EDR3784910.1 hypothetical protein [Salmonella enterica]EEH2005763.1 hypothetical protein [Salmonella enterica]EEJ0769541.1 hypothetical protein [Salmonella enterica]ELT2739299.1 hypothetical protein [Salmonella enterica]PVO42705.1 hypothetical protein C4744_21655 [Salmonella enterica subsp. enterica serovar Montevideo]